MPLSTATIHTAQLVERTRNRVRNPQGEYIEMQPALGTPFAARLMLPPPVRATGDSGDTSMDTARETVTRYEFLAETTDFNGDPVVIDASARIYFSDAGPLGTPTIDVTGQPELLNDGQQEIGWYGYGLKVADTANA